MKKVTLTLLAAGMLFSGNSYAGFLMKKNIPTTTVATTTAATQVAQTEVLTGSSVTLPAENMQIAKKQTVLSKLLTRVAGKSAEIPKILYVLLAIIGFGWLGMGINDNFNGWDWVISLVLYLLGWLPGLIYTLIKMNKYY